MKSLNGIMYFNHRHLVLRNIGILGVMEPLHLKEIWNSLQRLSELSTIEGYLARKWGL